MDTIEAAGHPRICAAALEAYNKERQDPPSCDQLDFDSSLTLLGRLVECHEHPVVVLDALDECPQEVRIHLLRGLLPVMGNAKCPLKVFIASRPNLDIEDYLRDLPHVCIEARDNGEDIENYVQQQLTLAMQEKTLELRHSVEEVILRDANGM